MDNPYVIWSILLFGIAAAMFFLELFIPSGGLIGLIGGTSLIAAIVMLFHVDTNLGLIGAIISVAGLPVLFAFALKFWPHTPIARALTLRSESGDDPSQPGGAEPRQSLPGAEGEAVTDLRPIGTCLIRGQRIECLAEGGMIRNGDKVVVTAADGMQVKVRRAE